MSLSADIQRRHSESNLNEADLKYLYARHSFFSNIVCAREKALALSGLTILNKSAATVD